MIQVQRLSRAWDYINMLVLRAIIFSMFPPCVHTNAVSNPLNLGLWEMQLETGLSAAV